MCDPAPVHRGTSVGSVRRIGAAAAMALVGGLGGCAAEPGPLVATSATSGVCLSVDAGGRAVLDADVLDNTGAAAVTVLGVRPVDSLNLEVVGWQLQPGAVVDGLSDDPDGGQIPPGESATLQVTVELFAGRLPVESEGSATALRLRYATADSPDPQEVDTMTAIRLVPPEAPCD